MVFANIANHTVNLRNDNKSFSYPLGDELLKFLSFDIQEVYALYIKVAEVFMDYHYGGKDEKDYKKSLAKLYGEIDKYCFYLHFYTDELIERMTELQKGSQYAMDAFIVGKALTQQELLFRHKLLTDDKNLNPYFDIDLLERYKFDMSKADVWELPLAAERESHRVQVKTGRIKTKTLSQSAMKKAIGLAVLFLAYDLKSKRTAYSGDISAITENNKALEGLTLTQKLLVLDCQRKTAGKNALYSKFSDGLWKTTFEPFPQIPENLSDKKIKDFIMKNSVEYRQICDIPHINGLIVYELLNILTSGAVIKKCRYCGNYFIPLGRSDTVFCDRIAKGETKPCRIIGSLKLHKAAKADNPIHDAHIKAYRRMNSKARTRRITQSEFLAWTDEARKKRDLCLNGELDFNNFAEWLDADKKKTG